MTLNETNTDINIPNTPILSPIPIIVKSITNNQNSNSSTQTNSPKANLNLEPINFTALMNNKNIPLSTDYLQLEFIGYDNSKHSNKATGYIEAYAANTFQGIIRNYNEDRVSIILNIAKPSNYKGNWPKCSFFGIYDGHGGSMCADFLRDHLHTYVIKDLNFPSNPKEAIKKGFDLAERDFINNYSMTKNQDLLDKSGSCAVVAIIINDKCYIANVGDSRAVLSTHGGLNTVSLTYDHKPNEEGESKRIHDKGGKVYQ